MADPEWRFAFRLALALGAAHPDYLLPYLTSRQFGDWMHFYELEPWGSEVEFLRSGIVASTMANCHRDGRKPAFKVKDFMPRFDKDVRKESEIVETPSQKMKAFVKRSQLNATRKNKKHG